MNHISRRLLLHEGQMLYDNIRSEFLQLSGRNLLDGSYRRKIDMEEICLALALQHRKMMKKDVQEEEKCDGKCDGDCDGRCEGSHESS